MKSIVRPNQSLVETNEEAKRPYAMPVLRMYGSVREFTQGSKGNLADGGTLQNPPPNSDRRLKTNVQVVGTHWLGIPLYLFDYKPEFEHLAGLGRQLGVMADEVEAVMPEAVVRGADGYSRVNYKMLGIYTPVTHA